MTVERKIEAVLAKPASSVVARFAALAQVQPDKLCFADYDRSVTYEEALRIAMGFAQELKKRGIGKDDKVCISCTQDCYYAISEYGVHLAGAILVPIEKGAAQTRIQEIMDSCGAKLYVGEGGGATLSQLCGQPWEGEIDLSGFAFPELSDTSEILFSTGTTGKSKGIEVSHGNDIALCENVTCGVEMEYDTVEMIAMPISHSHGLRRYNANIYNGSSSVFMDNVVMIGRMYELLDRYSCTAIDMSPSILTMIFKLSKDKIGEYRDQLRYLQIASSPLSEDAKNRIVELLPNTRMYNFYGCTESGCTITADFKTFLDRPGAMGFPAVNADLVFFDENRNIVAKPTREQPAYIATGGAQNMKGYWQEPELTAETVHNGYVVSKDLGYIEEDGMVFFIGRDDDVINAGGIKISPVEIEAEVMKYPGIRECACVPLKDAVQGEVPKLFYVLEEGTDLDLADFKAFLRKNIDANKVPARLEEIAELPRTYNGKIQRKKLMGSYDK